MNLLLNADLGFLLLHLVADLIYCTACINMKHRVFECKEQSFLTRKHKGLWKYFHNLITTYFINYGA